MGTDARTGKRSASAQADALKNWGRFPDRWGEQSRLNTVGLAFGCLLVPLSFFICIVCWLLGLVARALGGGS